MNLRKKVKKIGWHNKPKQELISGWIVNESKSARKENVKKTQVFRLGI